MAELSKIVGQVEGRFGSSLMRQGEIDALVHELTHKLLLSTSMLEVGTFEGVTAAIIAERCPNSRIVSVDPFIDDDPRVPGYVKKVACGRVADWLRNSRPNQTLWVGTLHSLYSIAHHDYDVVLIDGSHIEIDVLNDLRYASTMVLPDGLLAVHDYASTVDWPGVRKATDTFLRSKTFRLVKTVESMALLRRNG